MADSKLIPPFLKHDESAQMDERIAELIHVMGYEGYGLFWSICEFMHKNKCVKVGKEYLVSGDTDKVKRILTEFDLFRVEDGVYISDRILRDLKTTTEKSKSAKQAVNTRWLLAGFNKNYKEIFGQEVILSDEEVEALKKYNDKIADFGKLLPDILYSLKVLKFDTDSNFKPCANWLLSKNNLLRLINGEWGKLKKKPAPKPVEVEPDVEEEPINIESFRTKEKAIEYIVGHCRDVKFLTPIDDQLISRYKITGSELKEAIKQKQEVKSNENEHE